MRVNIIAAVLALAPTLTLAANKPPPNDNPRTECRQVWEHLMECKDVRTGRVVSTCRKNNVTGRWECQSR